MSTSSSAARARCETTVVAFPYHNIPAAKSISEATPPAQQDQLERERAAREEGFREGESQALSRCQQLLEQSRLGLLESIEQFSAERSRYFQLVEKEVVRLALAIAAKILRRESQIDPLLLGGMVRVALEQIGQSTQVTIHAHPEQAAGLRAFLAGSSSSGALEIVDDASVELNRCTLATALGTAVIGPEVQLQEIEKGLLDLQAARPR